jgi:hypothetical protein
VLFFLNEITLRNEMATAVESFKSFESANCDVEDDCGLQKKKPFGIVCRE